MLVQVDRNELGDKRLNPAEAVAKAREECLALASKKRIAGQDELEDPDRAFGPRLQFTEVITKLRRIIPTLKVLDGSPGNVALYAPRDNKEIEGIREQWDQENADAVLRGRKAQDVFFLLHKYVGGFPKEDIQEYGTVDVDNARLATKEHRAWRTVLIMLIEQGVVCYRDVVNEFGDVGTDRRGWRWRELTQKWRNNPEVSFSN